MLAPLHSLASRALEHGLPDPGSLLAHSLRQLDRIDSLSEQVSFLEEQLGSCECQRGRGGQPQASGQIWLDWEVVGRMTSDLSPPIHL